MKMHLYPALAAALLLSACGGGHSDQSAMPHEPPAMFDSFIQAVLAVVTASSESSEPTAVESTTVTTPDNTEPAPV